MNLYRITFSGDTMIEAHTITEAHDILVKQFNLNMLKSCIVTLERQRADDWSESPEQPR
jgi:hypothetical protein